jgi:hypothetical protein
MRWLGRAYYQLEFSPVTRGHIDSANVMSTPLFFTLHRRWGFNIWTKPPYPSLFLFPPEKFPAYRNSEYVCPPTKYRR